MAEAAGLPMNYMAARNALAECRRVDECAKWSAKALALKSYAKQMKDSQLEEDAQRIRDRAVQRTGELLEEIEASKGGELTHKRYATSSNGEEVVFRHQAAADAGLTPKQAQTAIEVARVEKDLADQMIDASPPASVQQLAAEGRTPRASKPEPKPFKEEWSDWTSAVEELSVLPACGLKALAERNPFFIAELRHDCEAAVTNLMLWREELSHVIPQNSDKPEGETLVFVP